VDAHAAVRGGFDGLLVHLRADFDVELLAVHSQQLVPERGVGVVQGRSS